ncbi:MAG: nickel-dependent lactate racemase, partial [Anaerolineae bacterium]|nr:nickel-dependent lactate racemase [Anaerolineae bacterium]
MVNRLLEEIQNLRFPAPLPETLLAVEQHFDAPRVDDIPAAVRRELENSGLLSRIKPGAVVAVGVGSRGVRNIDILARATVDRLKEVGAKPFIFPAMGSHGGATAEGQRGILAELGVTEVTAGVEIRSSMEVRQIGQIPNGPALYQDANAAAADHSLLINRVKPHTDFRSHIESGLAKMAVIGMGKQHGA